MQDLFLSIDVFYEFPTSCYVYKFAESFRHLKGLTADETSIAQEGVYANSHQPVCHYYNLSQAAWTEADHEVLYTYCMHRYKRVKRRALSQPISRRALHKAVTTHS